MCLAVHVGPEVDEDQHQETTCRCGRRPPRPRHAAANAGGVSLLTEGGGNANDETLSGRELIGDVDLLVGSALDQLDVWDGVSCFDHDCGCCVELTC